MIRKYVQVRDPVKKIRSHSAVRSIQIDLSIDAESVDPSDWRLGTIMSFIHNMIF